jgi:Ca2+-binding RTX toxin-like protein
LLETRTLPAGVVVLPPTDGVLRIIGTEYHDEIDITGSGPAINVRTRTTGAPYQTGYVTRSYSGVERIVFQGGDGDDDFQNSYADRESVVLPPMELDGGPGGDRLYGGSDDDVIQGGPGSDTLFSFDGNDILYGGSERDFLHGGENDDCLCGHTGDDRIYGENGNDTLFGGGQAGDDLRGGNGENHVVPGDGECEDGSTAAPDIHLVGAAADGQGVVRFQYAVRGPTGPFKVALYRSADHRLDASDEFIVSTTVTPVPDASGSGTFELALDHHAEPGQPCLIAVADPANRVSEINEDNNLAVVAAIDLYALGIDEITQANTGDTTVPGTLVTTYRLANNGRVAAGPFTVAFYASVNNGVLEPSRDVLLKEVTFSSLDALTIHEAQVTLSLPAALRTRVPGQLWVGFVVDRGNAVFEASEANNRTIRNQADDFNVRRGQFTFDLEGAEGGRYHSRRVHWPGTAASGVTIGRGYDMGGRTRAEVEADLIAAGVPADVAALYAGGAGRRGAKAGAWVRANRGTLVEITPAQQKKLFEDVTYARYRQVAVNAFPDFDEYPLKVQEAIFDMAYNLGGFGAFPTFSAAVRRQDWVTAARESNRPQVGELRNRVVRELFLSAAQECLHD